MEHEGLPRTSYVPSVTGGNVVRTTSIRLGRAFVRLLILLPATLFVHNMDEIFTTRSVPRSGSLRALPRADHTLDFTGFMQVPWVEPGTPPPHSVKHSIKCFNQPVSYKNPAALALPVTYVAFVPKDKSAEERAKTDKSWQRAVARGWTIRTFPGGHVAHQEDPRGVAALIEQAVNDRNKRQGEPITIGTRFDLDTQKNRRARLSLLWTCSDPSLLSVVSGNRGRFARGDQADRILGRAG
jgi:hypothetical protein